MVTDAARAAYADLEQKVKQLQDAIDKMADVYDTQFFGLNEWIESLDECMFDLDQDMQESECEDA